MRYDSGQLAVLDKLQELEEYVYQNEDATVQEKRGIRMALRSLDGLVVSWPYTHTQVSPFSSVVSQSLPYVS